MAKPRISDNRELTAGFTIFERSSMARGISTRHYYVFAIADASYGITETHSTACAFRAMTDRIPD